MSIDFIYLTLTDRCSERFESIWKMPRGEKCLDIHERAVVRDGAAREWICSHYMIASRTQLQRYNKMKRDAALLRELKDAEMSVRQLERLTGINRGVIQKA